MAELGVAQLADHDMRADCAERFGALKAMAEAELQSRKIIHGKLDTLTDSSALIATSVAKIESRGNGGRASSGSGVSRSIRDVPWWVWFLIVTVLGEEGTRAFAHLLAGGAGG